MSTPKYIIDALELAVERLEINDCEGEEKTFIKQLERVIKRAKKKRGDLMTPHTPGPWKETHMPHNPQDTYTPGPWIVEHPYGEKGVYITHPSSSALIAKVYEADGRYYADKKDNIEANARLIAKAPAMLEALRLCKAFIDHGPSSTRSAIRCKEAYDKALEGI